MLGTLLAGLALFTTCSGRITPIDDDYPSICGLRDLDRAVIAGDADLVKKLIAGGAEVDAANCMGLTAMNFAVSTNSSAMVELLAENKADLKRLAENGRSYADLAVFGEFVDALKGLLKAGLPPDFRDDAGDNPILLAVEYDSAASTAVLADFGADLNQTWGQKNAGLLHWGADHNSRASIRLLISRGLAVNGLDANLWTPLHYAAASGQLGNVEAASALVDLGACVNCKSAEGYTPRKVAQLYNKQWMDFYLSQHGGTV